MFLIDKYTPTNIKDAYFHQDIIKLLHHMSKDEAIPHIIFYGPDGAGKKTIIKLFLEMLFDKNVHRTKEVPYKVTGSGNKTVMEKVKQSDYHITIDPKNNNFDRYLIHDIVKEYAKRRALNIFKSNRAFKVVLINNVDNMSYYAQTSLRRTMERYNDKCRFIMWCKSLSKVILPLQSRCICIRIPAPNDNDLFSYIFNISVKENIQLSLDEFATIIHNSNGNIKQALWDLDYKKHSYNSKTDYYKSLNSISELLMSPTLNNVMPIRHIISSLMITNLEKSTIMKDLIDRICMSPLISDDAKQQIVAESTDLEYGLVKGRREILQFDPLITFILMILDKDIKKIPRNK